MTSVCMDGYVSASTDIFYVHHIMSLRILMFPNGLAETGKVCVH